MASYDHKKIEKKWQKSWSAKKIYQAKDFSKKPKFYSLIEFPYPSGEGLHVGHIRSNTAMDIISRKRRAEGFNVLYPIGWDAFGLPTENYAIKTGIHPIKVTKKNTDTFRDQLKAGGFSFDWSREINTTDPKYYKWTQWIFLQMLKKDLAYKTKMPINWCLSCKIGLANEEVVNGKCERCGGNVEKREKEQWMLAITKYADRLDKDLDKVDYLEKIKIQQRNWIGRSEGAELEFKIKNSDEKVEVFTTRPDTLFGVTYVVLSPEHQLVQKLAGSIENFDEVKKYIEKTKKETEIERTAEGKEKTGVELKGITAINPANNEEVPVWIADYVLVGYGTGAVMAVPAHDDRDFAFAKKYNLDIKQVIAPFFVDKNYPPVKDKNWVPRRNVQAIVRHPEGNKIIQLKWKKVPWKTFVIGGASDQETYEEAVVREIKEETGYKNIKNIKRLGWQMESHFYAEHKDINRCAYTQVFVVDLENLEKDEIEIEEAEKHEVAWIENSNIDKNFWPVSELSEIVAHLENGRHAFVGDGKIINSGKFDGMESEKARKAIAEFAGGKMTVTYKLKDWVFSRQRYWGEPIPVIHCESCGIVPVPEKDLPVKLPIVQNYKPTDTGESPLASIEKWINVKCPNCKGKAKRETDTMPNWAGSSWYFLRYVDSKNQKNFADLKKLSYWTPVSWYNGGMEHTTLHLLYSRFWHKFLFDLKLVPTDEPYAKRTSHGMILAENGEKMSKSKGNVVNPDDIIKTYGADTLRIYEMFMGPFDQSVSWNTESIMGSRRFIEKVWRLKDKVSKSRSEKDEAIESLLHITIKKVGEDIEKMSFNTAISSMMIFINQLEKKDNISKDHFEMFLKILAPFAPHITEEIWSEIGHKKSIHLESWPEFDAKKIKENKVILVVQINGKVRVDFEASIDTTEEEAVKKALSFEQIKKWTDGKNIKKIIFVKGRLLNIVI